MDNSVKCSNCRFLFISEGNILYCRKKSSLSYQVKEDYWCGEFKRKFIHEESNRNLNPDVLVVRQCGNCVYLKQEIQEEGAPAPEHIKYICTYNPPIIIMESTTNRAHTVFPSVNKKSSCSKFRAREIIIEEPQNVLTSGKRAITFGDS